MDDFGRVAFTLAILRRAGVGFADAWEASFPRPRPSAERVNVRVALAETQAAWRRAFDGAEPTRGEVAASMLAGLWSESVEPESVGEVAASRCGRSTDLASD